MTAARSAERARFAGEFGAGGNAVPDAKVPHAFAHFDDADAELVAEKLHRGFGFEAQLNAVEGEGANAGGQLRLRHAGLHHQHLYADVPWGHRGQRNFVEPQVAKTVKSPSFHAKLIIHWELYLMPQLAQLLTEQRNPRTLDIDHLPTLEALERMHAEDRLAVESVTPELPRIALAVDAIAERLRHGGRLLYIGAGTSGRLGVLDASECPPTFSVSYELVQGIMAGGYQALYQATESSEDSAPAGVKDIEARKITKQDVLVGIAASGRTPYVLGAIAHAQALGALTVGISCTENSELSQAVDLPIEPKPGPEVITGSTRLKAGTVTKLVLNMLSTMAMVRLGYVYSNLMVNVKPSNAKLVDRARRIISQAAHVSEERAAELLEKANGQVREAIRLAGEQ